MSNDYIYDLEVYPNVFTMAVEHADYPFTWAFEISPWRNDSKEIIEFVLGCRDQGARLVGYNNLGFDYPILHMLVKMGYSDAQTLYLKCQAIIDSQNEEDKWAHQVRPDDRVVQQIDLYKICHFDNRARATGLKALEFNMRLNSIQDLPFKPGSYLTREQLAVLRPYNAHDVHATKEFYFKILDKIKFREELTLKYQRDFMNHNDTKIGKDYLIMKLEEAGIPCYDYGPSGRTPRQTKRPRIALRDAIPKWIKFENPEFTRILNWFKEQTITETKGVFEDIIARINGFDFVFGLGGIHGSVENRIIESDDEFVIIDIDVASMYPNIAIANGFYPEHLGPMFINIYQGLYEQRKSYAKGTAENAMLKLGLNGVFGDSNSVFSVFFDPLFTMSITLSGQLEICMLAEQLMQIHQLSLIQLNTDGATMRVPRRLKYRVEEVCKEWEKLTKLQLEEAIYSRMFIRDVNNYIGEYENGKVKRKGAYEWDVEWHQNAGGLVIAKVAEQVLVHGKPIRETVEQWPDLMDFCLRTKVPRNGYLQWGEAQVQNTSRYLVTVNGKPLTKWLPPLAKKPGVWRSFAIESGWKVQICNDIKDADGTDIDYEYYIQEIEKITLCLS